MTRGLRNNNPGNIRRNYANNWRGLASVQSDTQFCQFISIEYGIRALYKLLCTYYNKYGCRSVYDFISRYAPPSENSTTQYVKFVADFIGISPFDLYFTPIRIKKLIAPICFMESNYVPTQSLIDYSIKL